jgi:hypothetical protein
MTDETKADPSFAALNFFGGFMQMGAEMVAFGAKRFEKDIAFQKELLQAKPGDVPHLQMQFWQGVLDDYHEESGKLVEMARNSGVPVDG